MTSELRSYQQLFILLLLLHYEQQQDLNSKLRVIPSKWIFSKWKGWTSAAADGSKKNGED